MTERPGKEIEGGSDGRKTWAFLIVCLMLQTATSWLIASTVAYPTSNDEDLHLSYVFHVKVHRSLLPNHYDLRFSDAERPGTFTEKRSHLKHPSFFYWLFTPLADTEQSAAENAFRFRVVNIGLSTLAVALFLVAGFGLLTSPGARVTYALIVVLCPKYPMLGGTFNNDTLVLLGTALAFLGIARLARAGPGLATGVLAGTGLALAGLAKFTGFMGVGFFIVFAHLFAHRQWRPAQPANRMHFLALTGLGVIGALPYLATILLYGYLIPTTDYVFWESGPTVVPLGPLLFVVHFLTRLATTWGIYEIDMIAMTGPLLVVALAVWAGVAKSAPGAARDGVPVDRIATAGVLSAALMLAINIVFIYPIHRDTGDLGGMSIRYYLPLWPLIALGAATAAARFTAAGVRKAVPLVVVGLLTFTYFQPYVKGLFERQGAAGFDSVIPELIYKERPR